MKMNKFSKDITAMAKEFDLVSNIITSPVSIAKKLITRKQNSLHMIKSAIENEIKNKNRSTILKLLAIEIEKKYGSAKNSGGQLKNKNAKGSKGPTGKQNAKKPKAQTKKFTLPNTKITKFFHTEIESFLEENKMLFSSKGDLTRKAIKKIMAETKTKK